MGVVWKFLSGRYEHFNLIWKEIQALVIRVLHFSILNWLDFNLPNNLLIQLKRKTIS